jgi:phosphatidylglycerophosphate synthase
MGIALIETITQWPSITVVVISIGIPIVFSLDAVDGMLARWLKVPTLFGSFLDIAADRAVEFIFLRYLISEGAVPLWFPVIFYGRILITDACRILAFGMQKVLATGIMLPQGLEPLVLSKASRTIYAILKAVFFGVFLLGIHAGRPLHTSLNLGLMFSVLAFSMLRATPIVLTYLPQWRMITIANILGYFRADINDIAPRSTKIISCLQLISDFGLAAWLLVLFWR